MAHRLLMVLIIVCQNFVLMYKTVLEKNDKTWITSALKKCQKFQWQEEQNSKV